MYNTYRYIYPHSSTTVVKCGGREGQKSALYNDTKFSFLCIPGWGGCYKAGNQIKRREQINENFPKFIFQDQKYRIFLFCKNSNSSLIQSLRWLYPFDDYILNPEF